MTEFAYKAKDKTGQVVKGTIDVPSENVAIDSLHERELVVLSVEPVVKAAGLNLDITSFFGKPKTRDIAIFTRQLATLIDADMPLAEGLRTLGKQVENIQLRKIVAAVSEAVEGGSTLSGALSEHPKLFSQFFVKMVKSGELSGKLQESLNYLADYTERIQGINSKLKSALAYPIFVIFAMVVVVIIIGVYVMPQLLQIFQESENVTLPIQTRFIIWMTDFLNNNLILIMLVVIGAPVSFWRYISTDKGRIWFDDFKLKMPIFGKILKSLFLARLAESLSTLIRSDVAILDALKITAELVGNNNFQIILLDAEENVRGGGSISDTFAEHEEIPALMTSMIAIGERTGKMEYMLGHISKFYRTESDNAIGSISQLIEPVIVVILGVGVAVLVSGVLLPIYSLVGGSG